MVRNLETVKRKENFADNMSIRRLRFIFGHKPKFLYIWTILLTLSLFMEIPSDVDIVSRFLRFNVAIKIVYYAWIFCYINVQCKYIRQQ